MSIDLNRLKNLVPLDSLPEDRLTQVPQIAQVQTLGYGAPVFQVGDTDNDFIYLQSGAITLSDADRSHQVIFSSDDQSRYPLSNLKPRQYAGHVASPRAVILRIDGTMLERLLAWGEVSDGDSEDQQLETFEMATVTQDVDWTMALLQTKAFLRLPSHNIEKLFQRFEPVEVKAGDQIIRFGDPGDYFYIIQHGQCEVTRPTASGPVKLAVLKDLDSFGEDALVSDEPRNADVTMLTDGLLLRLAKEDFDKLLKAPLIRRVTLAEAGALVRKDGALKVDVRTEQEFEHNGIPGAVNIPLFMIRLKAKKLPMDHKYVLYCDTGVRSEAAAFVLANRGFDVYVLKGGLTSALNRSDAPPDPAA